MTSETIRPAIFRVLGSLCVLLAVWGVIVLLTTVTVLRLAVAGGEQVPEAPPIHLASFLYVSYAVQLGLEILLFVAGLGIFALKPWSRRAAIVYAVGWCAVVTITALVVRAEAPFDGVAVQYLRSMLFPVVLLVLMTRPSVAKQLVAFDRAMDRSLR